MALRLDPVPQIWGITGNLGGGKSLSAVCLAAYAMSRGFYIVSNISLNLDALALEYGDHVRRLYHHFSFEDENFDPFALPTGSPRGSRGGKRVLVIMDECAEWIDQYSSVQSNPRIKKFLSWLRHSSKRSQDVILVVQRLDYLNKNIRLLISKWLIVDDLRVWRCPVLKLPIPFMGGFVMQRVFDRNKKLIQGPCIVNKRSFGRFYNTAECLNTEGATVNSEYELPRLNNYPFVGYVMLWFFSVLLLLVVLTVWNDRLGKLGKSPISRMVDGVSVYQPRKQFRTRTALRKSSQNLATFNPSPARPSECGEGWASLMDFVGRKLGGMVIGVGVGRSGALSQLSRCARLTLL